MVATMGTFRETSPAAKSEEKRTFSQAKYAKQNKIWKTYSKNTLLFKCKPFPKKFL